MASVVTIWNMALSAMGARGTISSETESGREADLCRLWYPHVRDVVLKAASWPCAAKWARLSVLTERDFSVEWAGSGTAPTYRFLYAAPAEMLAPRHLMSYRRFSVGEYNDAAVIHADEEDAVLCYTKRVDNTELWDTGLTDAVVAALGAKLCIPLSGKEGRRDRLKDEAVEAVLLARTQVANEEDARYDSLPSWIEVRDFSLSPQSTRYIHPLQDINTLAI